VYLCEHFGLNDVAKYWEQVVTMNDYQKRRFSERIVRTMFNTVSDKRLGIWGFAFKKDTNDTRESAAIYVCRDLLREHAKLAIYDPRVPEDQIRRDLIEACTSMNGEITKQDLALIENNVEVVDSAMAAADDSHAVAVLTEWDEFKEVDLPSLYSKMHQPAFVFDGRNLLDHAKMRDIGFEVHAIGKGLSQRQD
ncbi:MAG: UDP binding domain-containing protein, partial [Planctomycetota bacterium]